MLRICFRFQRNGSFSSPFHSWNNEIPLLCEISETQNAVKIFLWFLSLKFSWHLSLHFCLHPLVICIAPISFPFSPLFLFIIARLLAQCLSSCFFLYSVLVISISSMVDSRSVRIQLVLRSGWVFFCLMVINISPMVDLDLFKFNLFWEMDWFCGWIWWSL